MSEKKYLTIKEKRANPKVSDKKWEEAKRMFMEYSSVTTIAALLGIKRSTVQMRSKKWKEERKIMEMEKLDELKDAKAHNVSDIMESSIHVIKRFVQEVAMRRDSPPTIQEMHVITKCTDLIDKIYRLDKNEPTQIVSEAKPITVVELKKRLELDPFSGPEEIIHEESNSSNASGASDTTSSDDESSEES